MSPYSLNREYPFISADHARYLFVRLLLRKESKWFRLSELKYESELVSPENIIAAMKLLCGDASPPDTPKSPKPPKGTKDDVICISDDEDEDAPLIKTEEVPVSEVKIPFIYAEDETKMTLRELLQCLHSDELKKLARAFKSKGSLNVSMVILINIKLSKVCNSKISSSRSS